MLKTLETSEYLNGLVVIEPKVFKDQRGFFMESYEEESFREAGVSSSFVQDNHSRSQKGVIRGMHFQWEKPMGKLLRVARGAIELVELDIRRKSPTFGEWISLDINDENKRIVWIPAGFANGFRVISDVADVLYKCTEAYNPKAEGSIRWDSFGKQWDTESPLLSEKDKNAQTFEEWLTREESELF